MIRHTCDMCNKEIELSARRRIRLRMMKPFIDTELEFCDDCFEKLINQDIPILGAKIRQKQNEEEERQKARQEKEV